MMKKKTTVISLMFACLLVYITPTYADKEEFLNNTNLAQSDSDGDGITDNIELAMGTDPNDPTSPLPVTSLVPQLSFNIAKSHYRVGDKLEVDLVENLDVHREMRVDLWIAIVLPDNTKLFVKNDPFNKFSPEPQRFNQTPLEKSDFTYRIMDIEVFPGIGGNYSFYAVYVAEGTNPMEDFTVIRSNVAMAEISLDDDGRCINITCSVEELSPIENMPIELEFTGVKPHYFIDDHIQIDLVEKFETVSNPYHHVDLWVTIILPNGGQLFFVDGIFEKFTMEQKPFQETLSELNNYSHRILDMILIEGIGGYYSFHAVYVKKGKNPMKDFTAIRSDVARVQIMLNNR